MANIFLENPNRYFVSVNTPDYPEGLVNPDLTNVEGVPLQYWKVVSGELVEMTQVEKDAVDAGLLAERKSLADNYEIDLKTALTALIKVINLRLATGDKITKTELVQALKNEVI